MKQEIFNNKCDNLVPAGGAWDNEDYMQNTGQYRSTTYDGRIPTSPSAWVLTLNSKQAIMYTGSYMGFADNYYGYSVRAST